jgi:precorrin-4 methylase
MQKTLDKIDQLIDLHTTMGSNLNANKLKEIRDEVVGMYSEDEVRNIIFKFSSDFDTKRNIEITLEEQNEWVEKFKKK